MDDTTTSSPSSSSEPPASAPAPAPRRITRSRRDRVIAGVCGGIGDYFEVDPVLVRVAFVALAFAGGAGVIAYLIALIVVPEEPGGLPRSSREERRTARWERRRNWFDGDHHLGQWIPIVALVVVASSIAGFHLRGDVGLALVLIAIGGALLWSRTRPVTAVLDGPSAEPLGAPSAVFADVGAAPIPRTSPVSPPRDEPADSRRPPLRMALMGGLVALGGLIGVTGVVALLADAPVIGAACLAVAAALVALGAVLGYSRRLVVITIVASLALWAAAAAAMPWQGGIGNRTYRPTTAGELRREYRLAIGDLTVDVSRIDFVGDKHVDVRVGIGQLTLRVPRNVRVVVNGRAEAGAVSLLGRHDNGVAVDTELTRSSATGSPTLRVDARVGIGNLQVSYPDTSRRVTG